MADIKSDKEQIPAPISREDSLLHNIIDGTPDITDLEPISREEVYLKYIALNGGGGGGDVNIVQTTGQSTTSVMSQKAVTDNLTTKVDSVDGKGLSTEDFTTEYKEKLEGIPNDIGNLGSAAYCDIGINEGNVPILNHDGKLDNAVIPSLALSETYTADNEEEMLDLPGVEQGDICVRTDENKTYILNKPPVSRYRKKSLTNTSIDDWVELLTPTDEVISVNGKKGNVTITSEDVDTYTKSQIDYKLPDIVQEKGNSTKSLMSQKAVSDNKCFGENSIVTYVNYDISIGNDSFTEYGIAIGKQSKCDHGIAIGSQSKCYYGIAIGDNSQAYDPETADETTYSNNIAIGKSATCNQQDSVALGNSSQANEYSVALGNSSQANEYSVALGCSSQVNAKYSVALGCGSQANEESTVSVGGGAIAGMDGFNGRRRIVNVADPLNLHDAVTKNYVDLQINNLKKVYFIGTITKETWQIVSIEINGVNTPYYINEIYIPGIKSSDLPIATLAIPNNINDMYSAMDSWYCISRIVTKENGIYVTALNGLPNQDLDINLICFR